ncbi:MAG TPA: potassium channel family protein [Terriglobales bacterium]|nr:potassium channel family protein [Terriglobales bacterium]
MHPFISIVGFLIILLILLDAFETVVLPRRVVRHFRPSVWFYRNTWRPWARASSRIASPSRRESFLGYFGPLSLLLLLGMWAAGLIFGFALLQFATGEHLQLSGERITFGRLLYHSGETFFTLGYGDIIPVSPVSRLLAVLEAGMGFGFLGTVIGYLPTIYAAFSRREIAISLLDARAGSPPTVAELLGRFGAKPSQLTLDAILRQWERWAAEVLESHLSYPVLLFYRSQHNNQSWLGALTAILDTSSLLIAGVDGMTAEQAKITFAMARHAVVDLAQTVRATYNPHAPNRLPDEEFRRLQQSLAERGLQLRDNPEAHAKLSYLRSLYEPYVVAMARNLVIVLPPWIHLEKRRDNWQAGPWDRIIQARGLGERPQQVDEHF